MKKGILISLLFVAGCSLPYHRLKHRGMPYHTKAMYKIMSASSTLLRKKAHVKEVLKGFPYNVNSTLPANEFIDTSAMYQDKMVSFSARVESPDTDLIRLIFDYDAAHFGAFAPSPLLFPYPRDADHVANRYYIKLIPVDEFQKAAPEHVWDNEIPLPGLKMQDINYIHRGGLEGEDGFIAKNYKGLYFNEFSSLGMVFHVQLLDGRDVKCYLVTSDLYDNNSPRYVRWKIKI